MDCYLVIVIEMLLNFYIISYYVIKKYKYVCGKFIRENYFKDYWKEFISLIILIEKIFEKDKKLNEE